MAATTVEKKLVNESSFTDDLPQKIRRAKLFVVGAGGIGCELLKNLVLVGFQNIHVVSSTPSATHLYYRIYTNN